MRRFTDFDGDNDPDLFVLNMQGDDHYWENQEGEIFVDRSARPVPSHPLGNAMGVKFFDWDNDSRTGPHAHRYALGHESRRSDPSDTRN